MSETLTQISWIYRRFGHFVLRFKKSATSWDNKILRRIANHVVVKQFGLIVENLIFSKVLTIYDPTRFTCDSSLAGFLQYPN
ncbi:hypothetical protein OPV22_034372 [Ensete ventricosum]|uniref:Uncharacterized protein n=1 Tax=Ensete ventricosum TaxID=4639 RepID=A0AAV8PSC4_ENSVE|nr:hypothetical protein OPV22_034372 [Ensete ventricosum]